jgi:predicted O-methyltransferase YrrM
VDIAGNYNPPVSGFRYFLERVCFHLPLLHEWLAERDDLRRKSGSLQDELTTLRIEHQYAKERLDHFDKHLWVPPGHFYSPIPDLKDVEADKNRIFDFPREIPGINLNEPGQFELLDRFRPWYDDQPFSATKQPERRYFFENIFFSYADAIVLYWMMRMLRPKRIIEVGSGYSSCAMLDVNDLLFDGAIDLTFIEPYPIVLKDLLQESDPGRVRIVSKRVQEVPLDVFEQLEPGDILFVDSSHVAKTGSDVNHLLFKILPLLRAGVYIHFHDIFYPFEYPPNFVYEGRAWNEAYLLRAFLAGNRSYRIVFFLTYLMTFYPQRFEVDFPLLAKNPGGSLWLRKEAAS